MPETVSVIQNSSYETQFLAREPEGAEDAPLRPVHHIHELSPYGMVLAGLGSCTAILLNSYAQSRRLPLRGVEIRMDYHRDGLEDCRDCEEKERFTEAVDVEILLDGDLTTRDRKKLLQISERCPVHRMLAEGIKVNTRPAPPVKSEGKPEGKKGGHP